MNSIDVELVRREPRNARMVNVSGILGLNVFNSTDSGEKGDVVGMLMCPFIVA